MGSLAALIDQLEPEVEDPEEGETHAVYSKASVTEFGIETFLLYSQPIPSLDLGFIDPRAASVDVSVAGHDFTIHQSPAVLSSSRAGGTTGAGQDIPSYSSIHLFLSPIAISC
jgi:hypothetical protein